MKRPPPLKNTHVPHWMPTRAALARRWARPMFDEMWQMANSDNRSGATTPTRIFQTFDDFVVAFNLGLEWLNSTLHDEVTTMDVAPKSNVRAFYTVFRLAV